MIDIVERLQEYAADNGYSHNDYADTMRAAADEISRLNARCDARGEQLETLRKELAEAQQDNVSLLNLLALIREACGDNGKRMQDELVTFIRDERMGQISHIALLKAALKKERAEADAMWEALKPLAALYTPELMEGRVHYTVVPLVEDLRRAAALLGES